MAHLARLKITKSGDPGGQTASEMTQDLKLAYLESLRHETGFRDIKVSEIQDDPALRYCAKLLMNALIGEE